MDEKLLTFLKSVENRAESWLDYMKKNRSTQVYLYGAGNYCADMLTFMASAGVAVSGIVDSKRRGSFHGYSILSPEEAAAQTQNGKSCFVISTPTYANEIRGLLEERFPGCDVFTFEIWAEIYAGGAEAYRQSVVNNWSALLSLYHALEDAASRKTMEAVLKGRISGDLSWYAECFAEDMYYPGDFIRFSEGEVIADLGAYSGDTLRQFIALCPDYKAAYGFEPEPAFAVSLDKLCAEETSKGKALQIIHKAAWDKNETLLFSWDGNDGGTVRETAGDADVKRIEAVKLDDAVREPITFLKMDIEGSELHALKGAKRQISENKPKLAVCVYHKPEDWTEIWQYLRTLVPEYHFYLRHHGVSGNDTVLYAVV